MAKAKGARLWLADLGVSQRRPTKGRIAEDVEKPRRGCSAEVVERYGVHKIIAHSSLRAVIIAGRDRSQPTSGQA
eukprot:2524100-Rhodomonas_salina.1